MGLFSKIFGSYTERELKRIYPIADAIEKLEGEYSKLSDAQLKGKTEEFRAQIGGVHLWGKRKSEAGRLVSHCGDLTSYFGGDMGLKAQFLRQFNTTFDDGIARKMVLEVNSGNDDLLSIITDLRENGVGFI